MHNRSNWQPLGDHLVVVTADPYQTKVIGTAEIKNDRFDAKLLKQIYRHHCIINPRLVAIDPDSSFINRDPAMKTTAI